ncbi:hypothetical protein LX32DRAFT_332705 [Colletotrichum zoysiae]|uniref:Uncharacterized protein n=1 Tax=Colletotrichum zoysiae TaxID=1216348 RepID=A0AAD9M342_9PEZI|nr:hypothetical protein LX32DRAFT_332705 [Colletotrichum zoysiae]
MLCPSARRLPRYIRHPTPSPYRRLSTTSSSSSPSPANSKTTTTTTTTTTLAHNSLLTYISLTPSPISRSLVYIPNGSQLATTTAFPRLPHNQPSPPPPHQLQQLPSSLDSSSQLSQHRQTGFRKLRLRHHACPAPLATASLPRPPASAPSSCSAQPGLKTLRSTSALRKNPPTMTNPPSSPKLPGLSRP